MYLTYDHWTEAHEVYEQIHTYYGVPEWHDAEPDLVLYYDPDEGLYGWHQDEEIGVNFGTCETWADVVGTLLHEYWHHCQDPERMDLDEYEGEAEEVARRDLARFVKSEDGHGNDEHEQPRTLTYG